MASGGREPAQHDLRGRLEAAPRGSSAAGRAGAARSVVHCKNEHAHEQPLFREPVNGPMVLRNRPGLTEAPPGRMDAGKGKQRAKIAASWRGMS